MHKPYNQKFRSILVCISIILSTQALSQNPTNPSHNEFNSPQQHNSKFADSLRVLNQRIDVLEKKISALQETSHTQKLNEAIDIASHTIESQDSLLNGFGTLYTIITILLAIIGVALPILTYFFGIKPSVETVKALTDNLDKRFTEYLRDSRTKQINLALENLTSNNMELRGNAVNYLSLTQYEGFSDDQLFRIFRLLKTPGIDEQTANTLNWILAGKINVISEEYFTTEYPLTKDPILKSSALRYFVNSGFEKYLDIISNAILQSGNIIVEYLMVVSFINAFSKKDMASLLNHRRLNDALSVPNRQEICRRLDASKASYGLDKEIGEFYIMQLNNRRQ